jgi:hypothetical protein
MINGETVKTLKRFSSLQYSVHNHANLNTQTTSGLSILMFR